MIRFACPKCQKGLQAADEHAGAKIACPRCGQRVQIPGSGAKKKTSEIVDEETLEKSPRSRKTAPEPRVVARRRPAKKDREEEKSPLMLYLGIGGGAFVLILVGLLFGLGVFNSKKAETPKEPEVASNTNKPTPRPAPVAEPKKDFPSLTSETPKPAETNPKPAETTLPEKTEPAPAQVASMDGEKLVPRLLKSTVWIVTEMQIGNRKLYSSGSGSLIDKANKLILTNYHVVLHTGKAKVSFPAHDKGALLTEKRRYMEALERGGMPEVGIPGEVVWKDETKDLALIRLVGIPEGVQQLRISHESGKAGQRVHSIGNPGQSDFLWVYTSGTARQRGHKKWNAIAGREILPFEGEVLETQSPTNPGDSGGPLVNDRCELIGVTEGGNMGAQLMSFFMDVSEVRRVLTAYYKANKGLKSVLNTEAVVEDSADVPVLVKRLDDKDLNARAKAAEALAQIGPEARRAVPDLVKHLKDDDMVRKNVAEALAQIGGLTSSDVATVAEGLKDPNRDVRIAISAALVKAGSEAKEAVPALMVALKDDELKVKINAAAALAKVGAGAKEAVPALTAALKDPSMDIKVSAAGALMGIGPDAKPAVKPLVEALSGASKDLKLNVVGAFEKIGADAKEAVPALIKLMRENRADKEFLSKVIDALGAIGPASKEGASQIAIALEFKDIRQNAQDALVKIGKGAVPVLKQGLNDRNRDIRLACCQALEQIGPDAKDAVASLNGLAQRDPDPDVKEAAKVAVKSIQVK